MDNYKLLNKYIFLLFIFDLLKSRYKLFFILYIYIFYQRIFIIKTNITLLE